LNMCGLFATALGVIKFLTAIAMNMLKLSCDQVGKN